MAPQERILQFLQNKLDVGGADLARLLGISRQALNRHIQKLLFTHKILREGTTRGARYKLNRGRRPPPSPKAWRQTYRLKGLEEHEVFDVATQTLGLRKILPANVFEVLQYSFTEMLNNAIDHSNSRLGYAEIAVTDYEIQFTIRDWGIGIFYSIASRFHLPDEADAIGELCKGKTTTLPERHSGEGIFFTSKVAELLRFRSHKLKLTFDNNHNDIFSASDRPLKGTEVRFSLRRHSKVKLADIFQQYASKKHDFKFQKTRLNVKLFQKQYISRSEARRLLSGLEKFKDVILDFKGVKSIGQGFADEIFRVFQKKNSKIKIAYTNAIPAVKAMIRHVVDNEKKVPLTIKSTRRQPNDQSHR